MDRTRARYLGRVDHGAVARMGGSLLAAFALLLASHAQTAYAAGPWAQLHRAVPRYPGSAVQHDVPIRMDDGVVLRADVYRPADSSGAPVARRFPVIVQQTPYTTALTAAFGNSEDGTAYPLYGFVEVVVAIRGTGDSGGAFGVLNARERRDGYEVVQWAAHQPWSTGKVGLTGFSYMGASAAATAATDPPALKAVFNGGTPIDAFRDFFTAGGVWDFASLLWLNLQVLHGVALQDVTDPSVAVSGIEQQLKAEDPRGTRMQMLQRALGGPLWDMSFFTERDTDVARIRAPTFVYSGWEDLFLRGAPNEYDDLRLPPGEKQLMIGPWTHYSAKPIGPRNSLTLLDLGVAWFDHWLKGARNGVENLGPVTLFDQGSGAWTRRASWPLPSTTYRRVYLSGTRSGSARSLNDGSLTWSAPKRQGRDTGVRDPSAGTCSRSLTQFSAGFVPPTGKCNLDDGPNETRELTYTTERLRAPLRISGPIGLTLVGSSTASNPNWAVTVCDVAPNGIPRPITGGWLNTVHSAIDPRRTVYAPNGDAVEPYYWDQSKQAVRVRRGEAVKLQIEIWPTDWTLQPGHRLRIAIAPADFPHLLTLWDPQTTVGAPTVYRGGRTPSYLDVPVVPGR